MENLKQASGEIYAQVSPPNFFSTILSFVAAFTVHFFFTTAVYGNYSTLNSHTNTVLGSACNFSLVCLLVSHGAKNRDKVFWCDYILVVRFYIDATDFISRFYHIHMTSTRQLYSAIQYVNYIIMGQANEKMKLTCLLETIFHDVFTGHCLIFPSEIRNSVMYRVSGRFW